MSASARHGRRRWKRLRGGWERCGGGGQGPQMGGQAAGAVSAVKLGHFVWGEVDWATQWRDQLSRSVQGTLVALAL
uniref:Uncharacterized protein n=1 Tax=Globodera rostochiensis TaxID=31243 RepID=A0A914H9A4_GLORO